MEVDWLQPPPPGYGQPSAISLPLYSSSPGPNERSLAASTQPHALGSGNYIVSTDHMTLNLGPRLHGTSSPAYGAGGVIQGSLTIHKFKHLNEVTVTIWGKAAIIVSDKGFAVYHDRRIVLLHKIVIWRPDRSTPRPEGPQTFPVMFPIPTYARGRRTTLPPTMSLRVANADLDVRYSIVIDMIRSGLRRHECNSCVFFYLPRSIPSSHRRLADGFEEVEDKTGTDDVEWRMVDARPTSKASQSESIVQLGLPLPLSYTSGIPIPFRVTIVSNANLDPLLVKEAITVTLVRVVHLSLTHRRSRVDKILGTGDIWKVEDSVEGAGVWQITGSVKGGRPGGEVSWALADFVQIRYVIRLSVSEIGDVPACWCDEPVELVTHETRDFELEETREMPAIGMINLSVMTPRSL